jgi:hypothetical protein
MVTPAAERKAVVHLRDAFGMSERRACNPLGSAVYDRRLPNEPLEVCANWPDFTRQVSGYEN